jgi:hypothetical protein
MQLPSSVTSPALRSALQFAPVVAIVLGCASSTGSVHAASASAPAPVKIVVFGFELEDDSPAALLLDKRTSRSATLERATDEAGHELVQSGRFSIVDGNTSAAKAVKEKTLRNCDGCEAQLALELGAQQSLIGVVRTVTQTDYYVLIRIRDAHSGKVLDQEEANFAGDDTGWPSGVRMLIKHQVLPSLDQLAGSSAQRAEPGTSH